MNTTMIPTLLMAMALFASASRGRNPVAGQPKLLAFLGQKNDECQCTFKDQCSCDSALRFMDCVKDTCNSGDCHCIEQDGTNHFLESCEQMQSSCPGVGLHCMADEATCATASVHIAAEGTTASEVTAESPGYVPEALHKAKLKDEKSAAHKAFAFGIISSIVVLSVTVALASSSNSLVKKHTYGAIDHVFVTFLAVMWFHLILLWLAFFNLNGGPRVLVHVCLTIVVLVAVIYGSWPLRDNKYNLDIFNAVATPMVMFCSTGFVQTAQKEFTPSILKVFLAVVGLAVYFSVQALVMQLAVAPRKGWGSNIEAGVYGGALAGGFVLWLHMVVAGSFQAFDSPHDKPPSMFATMIMIVSSFVYIGAAVIFVPVISRMQGRSEQFWRKFGFETLGHFVSRLPHFSCVLSLGHLIVDNSGFPPASIMSHLILALVSSAIGILMIFMCAFVPALKQDTNNAEQLRKVLLQLGGFMTAVGWCHLLNNSINMMVAGESKNSAVLYKTEITVVLSVCVFPVYVLYIKPLVLGDGAPKPAVKDVVEKASPKAAVK